MLFVKTLCSKTSVLSLIYTTPPPDWVPPASLKENKLLLILASLCSPSVNAPPPISACCCRTYRFQLIQMHCWVDIKELLAISTPPSYMAIAPPNAMATLPVKELSSMIPNPSDTNIAPPKFAELLMKMLLLAVPVLFQMQTAQPFWVKVMHGTIDISHGVVLKYAGHNG